MLRFRYHLVTLTILIHSVSSGLAATLLERRQLPPTTADASSLSTGFYIPAANGGSQLTGATYSGLGEPLNVIISSQSDAGVLTKDGLEEFVQSLYYSPGDCLSISLGTPQTANLGDGNGPRNETGLFRYNYMKGDTGTCGESLNGGNHFRYWLQNGTTANTGAIFIAASVEMPAAKNHMILANGYDLGRDQFVANATKAGGIKSPGGFEYTVTAQDNTALLNGITPAQINHNIGTDGVVKVLTIRITKNGTIGAGRNATSSPNPGGMVSAPESAATLTSYHDSFFLVTFTWLMVPLVLVVL